MNTIRRDATGLAHVIFGAACDDSLGDQLRVTVIATGSSRALPQAAPTTCDAEPCAGDAAAGRRPACLASTAPTAATAAALQRRS